MAGLRLTYEFSPEDNKAIDRLVLKMRRVGLWFELYGAILVFYFLMRFLPRSRSLAIAPLELITGLLFLFLGNWTRRGARAFREIVLTEGRDVDHLMEALRQLSYFYGLIDRAIFVVLILAILVGILIFQPTVF